MLVRLFKCFFRCYFYLYSSLDGLLFLISVLYNNCLRPSFLLFRINYATLLHSNFSEFLFTLFIFISKVILKNNSASSRLLVIQDAYNRSKT